MQQSIYCTLVENLTNDLTLIHRERSCVGGETVKERLSSPVNMPKQYPTSPKDDSDEHNVGRGCFGRGHTDREAVSEAD